MLLKACLNGARRPAEHPALPITSAQLAADVVRVRAAGAAMVHVHAKDGAGEDTLDGDSLANVLTAIRTAAPTVPVGVTTGAWTVPDPGERVAALRAWSLLPDFASVNWHEPGADQVAAELLDRGVDVEAGIWHAAGLECWLASPYRDLCCRVLLELPDESDEAGVVKQANALIDGLKEASVGIPVLLHGEGASAWPALRYAGRIGMQTRIGLEDVLCLPDGSPAADNAALVTAARALLTPGPRRSD